MIYNRVNSIKQTHTLQEFIEMSGSIANKFDHKSFCMIEKRNGVEYPIYNVLDDYIEDLKEEAILITLSPTEIDTYKYQPKLLSDKLYKTTLWYYLILRLNNLCNVHEFTISNGKLYLIPYTTLKDLLSTIYSNEKTAISTYNSNHNKDVVEPIIRKRRI